VYWVGVLLSGLKTFILMEIFEWVMLLMFLFIFISISYRYICTVLLGVVSSSEVLFLLSHSVLVCFICKFLREFSLSLDGFVKKFLLFSLVSIGW
jgi:hypothetical protein